MSLISFVKRVFRPIQKKVPNTTVEVVVDKTTDTVKDAVTKYLHENKDTVLELAGSGFDAAIPELVPIVQAELATQNIFLPEPVVESLLKAISVAVLANLNEAL